jgi:glycogen phosphorylase
MRSDRPAARQVRLVIDAATHPGLRCDRCGRRAHYILRQRPVRSQRLSDCHARGASAAESLRKTVTFDGDGQATFDPARELADYPSRAYEAWPHIEVTDVDSTGLPDTPVLGSKLTLTATVQLAGLRPDEVTVQAVVGRVDTRDALLDPVTVEMPYIGTAAGGDHIFATTTPLPVAGSVGYTVRVLPHHPMLAADAELGLVTLASAC